MRGGIGSPKAEKLSLCSAEKGCIGISDGGKGRAWQQMQRAVLAWKFCPFQHARRRCGEAAQPCSGARIVMVAHRGSTCPRACFYKVERALREQLGPQGPAARCAHVTCCVAPNGARWTLECVESRPPSALFRTVEQREQCPRVIP